MDIAPNWGVPYSLSNVVPPPEQSQEQTGSVQQPTAPTASPPASPPDSKGGGIETDRDRDSSGKRTKSKKKAKAASKREGGGKGTDTANGGGGGGGGYGSGRDSGGDGSGAPSVDIPPQAAAEHSSSKRKGMEDTALESFSPTHDEAERTAPAPSAPPAEDPDAAETKQAGLQLEPTRLQAALMYAPAQGESLAPRPGT